MIKFNKRNAFSLVLCVMLVFCVGFYSSAQPTTAWFSQSDTYGSDKYKMEELYVEFTGDGLGNGANMLELEFKASTKLSDEDEREKMFEHTAEFYVFSAKNTGTLPAKVVIDISDSNSQPGIVPADLEDNGVRHFIYEFDNSSPVDEANVTGILGIKNESTTGEEAVADPTLDYREVYVDLSNEARRVIVYDGKYYPTGLNDNLFSKINADTDLSTVDAQKAFLKESINEESVILQPGEEKLYCICFWIDYSAFVSINAQEDTGVRTHVCNVNVDLNAIQHVEITEPESSTSAE